MNLSALLDLFADNSDHYRSTRPSLLGPFSRGQKSVFPKVRDDDCFTAHEILGLLLRRGMMQARNWPHMIKKVEKFAEGWQAIVLLGGLPSGTAVSAICNPKFLTLSILAAS